MSIELHDLRFSYGEKEVLRGIDLNVAPGERIGIEGTSGGGKSTLLKLLCGLYAPTGGTLLVQGAAAPADIRRKVSMVMQSAALLPVSIRENITCGHEMPEEVVLHACAAAQLCGWIETLPQGLDTHVGERGGKVSGGQAQRIAIARAIAKDAPVVLLDEITSALDDATGTAVLDALKNLTRGKTVVSVSHKREALAHMTRIYRLEGGKLTHA